MIPILFQVIPQSSRSTFTVAVRVAQSGEASLTFAVSDSGRAVPAASRNTEDTGPFRHIVYLVGNTLFGLHGFPDLVSTEPFSERRPGLDHIAFGVASRDELADWAARLDELGVTRSDIVNASYGSAYRSTTLTTSRSSCSPRRGDRHPSYRGPVLPPRHGCHRGPRGERMTIETAPQSP